MSTNKLLTPDNHALLLIDHQYLQLLTLRSHEAAQVIGNVQAVAKVSKIFKVPALLTTAFAERQDLIKEVQDVYPNQKPIDRTTLNTWEDSRVIEWISGRQWLDV
jgi:nicotinamidase-related amidase